MKGRGILGALNKKSIRSLLEGIDEYEVSQKRIKGGNLNSIKSLYDEFLKTDSKPQRDRLINEFKKRNEEFAEFIQSNPDLVEAELQKALILAASGGQPPANPSRYIWAGDPDPENSGNPGHPLWNAWHGKLPCCHPTVLFPGLPFFPPPAVRSGAAVPLLLRGKWL